MEKPGIEQSNEPAQNDEAPGITNAGVKKKSGLTKILAAAALAGLGLYGLSKCEGNQGTQPENAASNAPATDPHGLYYIIRSEAEVRRTPDKDSIIANRVIQPNSCVQGVVGASGEQESANMHYHVRMVEQNGRSTDGYIHMGHIAYAAPEQLKQGCVASFKDQFTPAPVITNVARTFTNASTINLRDGTDQDEQPWGTLAPNSCVVWTGDQQNGMLQVGIITAQTAPNPVDYKWVRSQDVSESSTPPENCISRYTVGASAGVTPNPWN